MPITNYAAFIWAHLLLPPWDLAGQGEPTQIRRPCCLLCCEQLSPCLWTCSPVFLPESIETEFSVLSYKQVTSILRPLTLIKNHPNPRHRPLSLGWLQLFLCWSLPVSFAVMLNTIPRMILLNMSLIMSPCVKNSLSRFFSYWEET